MNSSESSFLRVFKEEFIKFRSRSELPHSANLEHIANLIKSTYLEKDNSVRRKNEEELDLIKRNTDWISFGIYLSEIIYFSTNLDNYLLERILIENKDWLYRNGNFQEISTNQLIGLYVCNLSCLLDKPFPSKIKNLISDCLEMLFKIDDFYKKAIHDSIIEFLLDTPQDISELRAMSIVIILKHIILEQNQIELKESEKYIASLLDIGFMKLAEEQNLKQEFISNHLEFLHTLTETIWIVVIKAFGMNTSIDNNLIPNKKMNLSNYGATMCFSMPKTTKRVIMLLSKIISSSYFEGSNKLVAFILDDEINKVVNNSKCFAIKTLTVLSFSLIEMKSKFSEQFNAKEVELVSEYLQIIQEQLKFVIFEIHQAITWSIAQGINLNQNFTESTKLINEAIQYVCCMLETFDFYGIYYDNYKEIFLDIILNIFLIFTQGDQDLNDNPNEFALKERDLVETRSSDTLTSNSSLLLYMICEKIDGVLPWISMFILRVMHQCLGHSLDFTDLSAFSNSFFFKIEDPNVRIQTLLLCLAILTKLINKREDLMKNLNEFLKVNLANLASLDVPLIVSRLSIFLKEMLPYLFENNEKNFFEALKFLFTALVSSNKLSSFQALDCLDVITDEKNQYKRVEPWVYDVLKYVEKLILEANEEPYFDFIIKFLLTYESKIARYGALLIEKLVKRTYSEFENLENSKTNIVIVKCLEAIENLLSCQDIVEDSFYAAEDQLQNVFTLLDIIQNIEFENELLDIATQIARHSVMNTPIFSIIQRNLRQIFEKNDKCLNRLFDLFYYWCLNGYRFINSENEELLLEMVEISLESIQSFPLNTLCFEYINFSKACLSFQMIIQTFCNEELAPFINTILTSLNSVEKNIKADTSRITAFRFFKIYYCLIFYYPTEILRDISDRTILNVLIEKIPAIYLDFFKDFDDSYSRKVISLGLMALLWNQSSSSLDEYLKKECLINIIKILSTKAFEEPIKSNISMNLEENKFEEKPNLYSQEKLSENSLVQIKIAEDNRKLLKDINKLEFPILKEDEYEHFRKTYSSLKENAPEFNDILLEILGSNLKSRLTSILSTSSFQNMDFKEEMHRKIVNVRKKV